nr:hypothetical protein [Tanacetum cinerariifolium]
MLIHHGEGSGTPSEPHHTPFPKAETSHPATSSIPLPSIPTVPIPPVIQPVITPIIQYSRRARIAQSSALLTVADEPASPMRDVSEGEACPTESGFIANQDRATIVNSSTLPHDLAPRVSSPAADEGIIRMARLQFCDYHNMVAILEKGEFNTDFHPMVDFIAASPLRRNLKLIDEDGIVSIPDTELFENLTLMG